ncbi:MAG TPA: tetratricopeptide repeat protein [Candidatus Cybelea sp.]|nr:tetratricopeptide repeat protein [Candidatus Cybelea sp.]
MKRMSMAMAACVVALSSAHVALAAGGGGGGGGGDMTPAAAAKPADPEYTSAVGSIDAGKFADAKPMLEHVIARDPKNADAYNYLGYVSRKLGDRTAALGFYGKALEIDPRHLGANEYLGELYLEMGDLPKAEARLDRLDDLCLFGCPAYTQLKQAIRSYKDKQPKS